MNRRGAGTNLTFLIIAIAAFVATITLVSTAYVQFANDNGASIDPVYLAAYNNISSKQNDLNTLEGSLTSVSLITALPTIASTFFNSIGFGLTAITNFFSLLTIIPSIINTVSGATGLPSPLVWFAIFAVSIFVAMKILKAIRGTPEEA